MSRILATIGLLFALLAGSTGVLAAQGTPAAGGGLLAELGLPEVVFTASEAGLEIPDDVQAGTVLLTLNNTAPFPAGFALIQLPEGVSMEDLMPPPGAEGAATPAADEEAAPEGGFPEPLFDATWAGGVFAMPGGTAQAVVTLGPGEWIVDTGPESGMAPQILTVSGEAAEAQDINIEAVAVDLDNFQIILPEEIQAGPQVWDVTNVGDQPHEIFVSKTPERLTVEEAEAILLMDPEAEPDPNLPNPEEFLNLGGVAPISQDQSSLIEIALEPGHYVAVCFMPDRETGEPHAMLGMVSVFSVGEDGEEVEPPASPVPADHEGH